MNCKGMAVGSMMVRRGDVRPGFVSRPLPSVRLPERSAIQPKARVARKQRSRTVCMVGVTLATTGAVKIMSMLLTSASVALGALILGQQLMPEQDQMERREPCPACGGTGYEACMCTRWSDEDVGCNGCGNTGYTRCRSCGGGGTAVPVPISIRRDS
ncbi:hypothetical protein BSKO_00506 [Bryopsis sp. KO-2023]|nr:hypothetical protein BSKO_00506 [Bryopsis sp. KO-2023]